MSTLNPLRLKKQEDRRLRSGHLWIYSNEIDIKQTPLTAFTPGQQVLVETHNGKPLGTAYINPHSLICARLISPNPAELLSKDLLIQRLKQALYLREQLFTQPFYRLVFAESDLLPGLIVDRYGDVLVAQINTAGMEQVKDDLRDALIEVIKPTAILLRNDSNIREMEHLPKEIAVLYGEPPAMVEIIEHECRFKAPIREGQKTGWFYDQRYNRACLKKYVNNKRVLDVFSYIGAWSIQAAHGGAREVYAVDSSATALKWLQENASINHCAEKITTLHEDAFKALQQLNTANEKFDVVIIDPPAFIKKRKDIKEGLIAYRRLNELAMRLLNNNGILISASCSMHLPREDLIHILHAASNASHRHLQILEQGHQAPDHPIHPAIPETEYLKMFAARIVCN